MLFNNAGYGLLGAVEETSLDEARAILETNFLGTFLMTRALLPQLRKQGAGHILNMSSGAGIGAVPGLGLYSATKFAVEGLSEALAQRSPRSDPRDDHRARRVQHGLPDRRIVVRVEAVLDVMPRSRDRSPPACSTGTARTPATRDAQRTAILRVVDEPEPPLRLVLGPDALAGARAKVDALAQQFRRLGSADAIYGAVSAERSASLPQAIRKHCVGEGSVLIQLGKPDLDPGFR